jgi:hypothetical protein
LGLADELGHMGELLFPATKAQFDGQSEWKIETPQRPFASTNASDQIAIYGIAVVVTRERAKGIEFEQS